MNQLVDRVRKIAVLRANALGDFVFCLPALESLKAAYPAAELVLLGEAWHERELSGRPGPVDRVIVVPDVENPPEPFLARVRAERFDLALQMHGGGQHSNAFVRALGAGMTAGLRARGAPPLDRVLPYVYFQPEVFRYLEVARLVGAPPVTYSPRFQVTAADVREAERVAGPRAGPRVVLHPGAKDGRRRWPPGRFAAVADALAATGARVLVTGSEAESDLVSRVESAARSSPAGLAGRLSLGGLAALYQGSDLVIANDTGPLHLAEAVGAATVGIYWIGNMINGAPVDRGRHRQAISWALRCPECDRPCLSDIYPERIADERCRHDTSFVSEVPVSEVVREAEELLSRVQVSCEREKGVGTRHVSGEH